MGIKKQRALKKKTSVEEESELLQKEWVVISPFKRGAKTKEGFITLANGYGYLNIMTIEGKDLGSLASSEITRLIRAFETWLTVFTADFEIETTKLPTNTDPQVCYLQEQVATLRLQLNEETNERRMKQLKDRERLLLNTISVEKKIKKEMYNVEFVLYLWADDPKTLVEITRRAKVNVQQAFRLREVSYETKEQILKQFNNMNEKI